MHRVLFLSALTLWACQDPSKLDDGDTAAPSDASPTTDPTGATDAVYTVSFALASAAARAGEPVTWSGEVRDESGAAVESSWDLASDLETLESTATTLTATLAGNHTITATVSVGEQVLDAEASLTISPGSADTVNLMLDDGTVEAGTETTWTFTAADAWGNAIEPAEPTLAAPDLEISPTGIGGTAVGFWEITATLDDAQDVETLRVIAGPAAVLDLELDDLDLEVGESTNATVTVTDAFGNPSGAPYTLWVEGGRHEVALDTITFLEDGVFEVYAEVPGGPMDMVGPIVIDSSGPELFVTEPSRGTFMDAASARVAGTALDERDPVPPTVATNGIVLPVDDGGAFSGDIAIDDGIQVLETTATDTSGYVTTDKRAVLNGASVPWGDPIMEGLHVRIDDGAGGLDVLSSLAEGLVDPDEIVAMLPDPVVDEEEEWCEDIWLIGEVCYTLYAITMSVDDASFGPTTVDIDPLPTGLVRVELIVDDPYLEWSADVVASEIPIAGAGTITASDFIIRVDVDPLVSAGRIQLDVANVYVSATDFAFDWDSWLQDVAEFFGVDLDTLVEDLVYDALESAVVDEVPPLFEEVLNDLEISEEIPILDNVYTLDAEFADVGVDTFGITLVMDTSIAVADWVAPEEGPGSYYVGYAAPAWLTERPGGTNLALSIDFINQLLYGLWGGGAMALDLGGDELGVGADELALLFPEAEGSLQIRVDALLPPVAVPGSDDMAELQLGDLRLTLTDEAGTVLLDAYAHGTAPMSLSSTDGTTFTPEIGDPELVLDVVAPTEGASDVEGLLVALVPTFLPLLTDSIVGIELPTIEGFGLTDVIVEPIGPDDGYLSLHGDLFEE